MNLPPTPCLPLILHRAPQDAQNTESNGLSPCKTLFILPLTQTGCERTAFKQIHYSFPLCENLSFTKSLPHAKCQNNIFNSTL